MIGFIRETWHDGWLGKFFLIMAFVGVPLLGYLAFLTDKYEEEKCAKLGGHMITKSTLNVGPSIGSKEPGVAVVPSNITFCVSEDGRILF